MLTRLINLYLRMVFWAEQRLAPVLMPTLARLVFAALFAAYFWNSALTKIGGNLEGLFSPTFNAFAQIFPLAAEAVSYDISQATALQKAIILAGTWAELLLPALIIVGLFTRIAAVGMVGFVLVQTVTDVFGHNALQDTAALGAWFDGTPASAILDQRALWLMLLLIPAFRGAGPLSVDFLIKRRLRVG